MRWAGRILEQRHVPRWDVNTRYLLNTTLSAQAPSPDSFWTCSTHSSVCVMCNQSVTQSVTQSLPKKNDLRVHDSHTIMTQPPPILSLPPPPPFTPPPPLQRSPPQPRHPAPPSEAGASAATGAFSGGVASALELAEFVAELALSAGAAAAGGAGNGRAVLEVLSQETSPLASGAIFSALG